MEANSFLYDMNPIYMGGMNENEDLLFTLINYRMLQIKEHKGPV